GMVGRTRTAGHEGAHRDHRSRGHRPRSRRYEARHRPDVHHDAADGRLSNHRRDPPGRRAAAPADHRADREGDEGRPREMPRGRRIGLPGQAGRDRPAAGSPEAVAASVNAKEPQSAPLPEKERVNILMVDDKASRLLTYRAILND